MQTNPKSGHDAKEAERRRERQQEKRRKRQEAEAQADGAQGAGAQGAGASPKRPLTNLFALNDAAKTKVISNKKRPSVQYPTLPNGKPNPLYNDLLFEYPPVSGQEFGVYSFISPERVIRNREQFMFEQYVRQWSYQRSVTMFSEFMLFLSEKTQIPIDSLQADLAAYVADSTTALKTLDITDDFAGYIETNFEKLDQQYQAAHGFETSVRGFAPLGNFSTVEAANAYAKQIREINAEHDVLVTKNFHWIPLDPDQYRLPNVEYLEPELNRLHQEKRANAAKAKAEFERRLYESKRKAIEANIRNAEKFGSKVTQTMDENGNLVNLAMAATGATNHDAAPDVAGPTVIPPISIAAELPTSQEKA